VTPTAWPNLAPVRARLARALVDACRITRQAEITRRVDRSTGQLVSTDVLTVYEGPCLVFIGRRGFEREQGGRPVVVSSYRALLAWDVLGVEPGDDFEVTASARDVALVGLHFRVVDVANESMHVARRLDLELAQ
jgi:hypothetical protein